MTPLQQAAQAVLERWESIRYANLISPQVVERQATELRKALDVALQQSVEPVLYQRRIKADWDSHWTAWDDCSEATFKEVLTVPNLHGWTHQARALYLHPPQQTLRECWYESDELEVCRKCGQLHDKAITPPQQAKQVPGWKADQIDDYEIRVTSPEGESWRLRSADKNDIFNNFIWRWARSMIGGQP